MRILAESNAELQVRTDKYVREREHMKIVSVEHPDSNMRRAARMWLQGLRLPKKQRNAVKFLLGKLKDETVLAPSNIVVLDGKSGRAISDLELNRRVAKEQRRLKAARVRRISK